MFLEIIKYFTIFICTIYIYVKITQYNTENKNHHFHLIILSLLSAILACALKYYIVELTFTIPLIICWILLSIHTLNPQYTFISIMIAFGLSFCMGTISSFAVSLLLLLFLSKEDPASYTFISFLAPILHLIFTFFITRKKRFKYGMPFLRTTTTLNIATLICLFFIIVLTYISSNPINRITKVTALFIFVSTLAFLIHWWQMQITKSYRHSLEIRELESLRIELQEKDKRLKELSDENKTMGHIIHEDNKILRAFSTGIYEYIRTDFDSKESLAEKGDALLEVINSYCDERTQELQTIRHNDYTHHTSSFPALDLHLNHFEKRALLENVSLHIHIACNLEQYVPKAILLDDLNHLITNLLDNAFIAASYSQQRIIQMQFYEINNKLVIEIADSGIPFEPESLAQFGLIRRTTHADSGGSGIGLMKIWEIKEKYRATLHIEEYQLPSPYVKKISLFFNNKDQFTIRT